MKLYKQTETQTICALFYRRTNLKNHEVANTHLTVNSRYCSRQCKHKRNLADQMTHSQADDHKGNKKMWCCFLFEKEMNIITKSKHINSKTYLHRKKYGINVKKRKL